MKYIIQFRAVIVILVIIAIVWAAFTLSTGNDEPTDNEEKTEK